MVARIPCLFHSMSPFTLLLVTCIDWMKLRWLGQNSKQTKLNRQLGDVQIRMRLKVSGDKSEIRQSYIPALFPHIVKPLADEGSVCRTVVHCPHVSDQTPHRGLLTMLSSEWMNIISQRKTGILSSSSASTRIGMNSLSRRYLLLSSPHSRESMSLL